LAAIALAIPWRWAVARGTMWFAVGALVVTLLVLSPVYIERSTYLSDNADEKQSNKQTLKAERDDLDNIVETLKGLPPGRIFAGLTTESGEDRWGLEYHIGGTAVAQILGTAGLDVFSTTLQNYSLVSNELDPFDEASPEQYNLFNIRYVVVPEKSQMPEFMKSVEKFGRHRLFRVETTGYFDLVGSSLMFDGDKEAYSSATKAWLTSGLPEAKLHPKISINGSPKYINLETIPSTVSLRTQEPSESSLESVDELNSYISTESAGPSRGLVISEELRTNHYSAIVDVERESMLMLKVAYHPNWRATVDGATVDTVMLIPGFVGIQLAPGEHNVLMNYKSRDLRKILLGFGLVALVSIWLWEKRRDTISAWIKTRVSIGIPGSIKGTRGARAARRRNNRRNR